MKPRAFEPIIMHTVRRACSALPSRTLLRGNPARNASGTLGLLRVAALAPTGPHTHGHKAPWGRGALYSTVAAEDAVPTKKKVWDSVDEAIADVKSGDILLSGGTCARVHHGCQIAGMIVGLRRLWTMWNSWCVHDGVFELKSRGLRLGSKTL